MGTQQQNNSVLWIKSTVYDIKYTALGSPSEDSSMPEESLERRTYREDPHRVERTQALISDDPEQSLRKLASIVELGIISLLDFINRSISIVQKIAFTKSANHFINRRSFLLKMTKSFIKIN